jgi:hypothetical protein
MPKKKTPELTDQERAKRIKGMAREIDADEKGEAFKRTMRKLASGQRASVKTTRGTRD